MKNRFIEVICVCLIAVFFSFAFIGCSDNDCDNYKQLTMVQIETVLKNEGNVPFVEGAASVSAIEDLMVDSSTISIQILEWQRKFERNNIDTTNFMTLDRYRYTGYFLAEEGYMTKNYLVHIFKFSDIDSATNCYENLNFVSGSSYKQYGNLVVLVDNTVSNYVFNLIDNIE